MLRIKFLLVGTTIFFCEGNELEIKNQCKQKGIIYLKDEAFELDGINFWGSPHVPYCDGWAFAKNVDNISEYWKLIPQNVNVLLTHTPPSRVGLLSKLPDGRDLGCPHLKQIVNKIKPAYHIFGHIHVGNGVLRTESTYFINCSIAYESRKNSSPNKKTVNMPFVFSITP